MLQITGSYWSPGLTGCQFSSCLTQTLGPSKPGKLKILEYQTPGNSQSRNTGIEQIAIVLILQQIAPNFLISIFETPY